MAKRRVVFLTGTRADFGKLKPLISKVAADPNFTYEIFATGMHMLARYGGTILEIRRAGFEHIYPFVNQDGAVNSQMDLVLSTTVQGLGHYVREFRPDLLVVHGDRVETLAGAIVGSFNNILVAHVEGGEKSGTVDELIRHAVTKLSHVHFVANEEARARLHQLGEDPASVMVTGSPDIDVMLSADLPSLDEVRQRYAIGFEQYGILLYHPVTTEQALIERHAQQLIQGVTGSGQNFVVIYPNNDAGAEVIMRHLEPLRGQARFRLLPSMRFEHFLTLLKNARVIIGNSSAGIREAPVYGTPTLNMGTRQANRYQYQSIVNLPESAEAITTALGNLPPVAPPSQHFGDGRSAERFHAALGMESLWETARQKQFRDQAPITAPSS